MPETQTDEVYEQRLARYLQEYGIHAEHLVFEASTHSVDEAAHAAGAHREDFIKSICLIAPDGQLVVAIVKGEDRASTTRVGQVLGTDRPRLARPEEMLERTGYPAGGTPPFGFPARFLIDPKVLEKDRVIGGGGSTRALVRIAPSVLQQANGGHVVRVRK